MGKFGMVFTIAGPRGAGPVPGLADHFSNHFPDGIFPFLVGYVSSEVVQFVRSYDANIVAEHLIPFFMMVVGFFPVTISLVIASESFVGEKERRSIEPLLSSPLGRLGAVSG